MQDVISVFCHRINIAPASYMYVYIIQDTFNISTTSTSTTILRINLLEKEEVARLWARSLGRVRSWSVLRSRKKLYSRHHQRWEYIGGSSEDASSWLAENDDSIVIVFVRRRWRTIYLFENNLVLGSHRTYHHHSSYHYYYRFYYHCHHYYHK